MILRGQISELRPRPRRSGESLPGPRQNLRTRRPSLTVLWRYVGSATDDADWPGHKQAKEYRGYIPTEKPSAVRKHLTTYRANRAARMCTERRYPQSESDRSGDLNAENQTKMSRVVFIPS